MFILLIVSLFFCWLIYREINNSQELDNFTKGYIALLFILAVLSGKPIIDHWRFESFLSAKASELADGRQADVKCATVFQSVFDRFGLAGWAKFNTGEIRLQYPICNDLRDYLDSPKGASQKSLSSLHVFVHEAMHVRGERDEKKTDCQAIQRNIRAAKMLGVRTHIAEDNALLYYEGRYRSHPYFSKECAKGKALDESLSDFVW